MVAPGAVIAIVDDDPRLLNSLAELLDSAGYSALKFATARELLQHGPAFIDVVITDIGLPGTDGFELRHLVRQSHPSLPVFMITGRYELAEQARARGITELFRKPFDAATLLAAVQQALSDRSDGG